MPRPPSYLPPIHTISIGGPGITREDINAAGRTMYGPTFGTPGFGETPRGIDGAPDPAYAHPMGQDGLFINPILLARELHTGGLVGKNQLSLFPVNPTTPGIAPVPEGPTWQRPPTLPPQAPAFPRAPMPTRPVAASPDMTMPRYLNRGGAASPLSGLTMKKRMGDTVPAFLDPDELVFTPKQLDAIKIAQSRKLRPDQLKAIRLAHRT